MRSGKYVGLFILLVVAMAGMAKSQHLSQEGVYPNNELSWHEAVLDSQGKLLAWYHPEQKQGYAHVLKLAWDFLEHKVPVDPQTGRKVYLVSWTFDDKTFQVGRGGMRVNHPGSLFGQFVDSVVLYYPFSGDREAIRVVREMLDFMLSHATTPAEWEWPKVPYTTTCTEGEEVLPCVPVGGTGGMDEDYAAGRGGIATDKVGELGTGYIFFYELTGDTKYRDAAIDCATALARHVRPGDADHTPWPFRVNAKTGAVLGKEEYGGSIASPLRLFDELIRLNLGDVPAYKAARDLAWKWVLDHPLNRKSPAWDKWTGYYEDVPKRMEIVNQNNPMMIAYYILTRDDPAEVGPQGDVSFSGWESDVGYLLDWVRETFGLGPFYGAWAINEQQSPDRRIWCCSRAGLGSHTSRWAGINAMYYEKTGDGAARENAFRSTNYATYFAADNGVVSCCGHTYRQPGTWFSDGYGDYLRHIMWVMGAIPELAPIGENHLVRSSSVVQDVKYGNNSVEYTTFDDSSTAVLRLAFKPGKVTAGGRTLRMRNDLTAPGWTWRPLESGGVARVHHRGGRKVTITR